MRRLICSRLLVIGLAASVWSCNSSLPSTPTIPNPTNETFTGTLTPNGAQTFTFISTLAGTVTATLAGVSPDTATKVGLALGTWNGSACQVIIANDSAILGNSIVGDAKATTNLCVRVYDVGNLTAPESVSVTVSHP